MDETLSKNLDLYKQIDTVTHELRILEIYRQDLIKELYPICQHLKTKDVELNTDNGYGKWSKHKYKQCLYCGAENHWGTKWSYSKYYFLQDLNNNK